MSYSNTPRHFSRGAARRRNEQRSQTPANSAQSHYYTRKPANHGVVLSTPSNFDWCWPIVRLYWCSSTTSVSSRSAGASVLGRLPRHWHGRQCRQLPPAPLLARKWTSPCWGTCAAPLDPTYDNTAVPLFLEASIQQSVFPNSTPQSSRDDNAQQPDLAGLSDLKNFADAHVPDGSACESPV
ncbi:unnamed protein product [Rhizoctonia solani]|uniref:Uncharacterized protein n=1 Tax=Rhizoctonia solani TaxID=456999 RepID=A0A8H3B6X9_9AGAM|nr:unnamed protein product [Rhizoctonia solani]